MAVTTLQSQVLDLLNTLSARRQSLSNEIDSIDEQIRAVTITSRLLTAEGTAYPEDRPATSAATVTNSQVEVSSLRGMTARQAMSIIAKANNGRIRVSDAKDLLINASILKDSKNTWNIVYTILKRASEFEKVDGEPGLFRLVEFNGQGTLPNV
jgi:hypothetical protein